MYSGRVGASVSFMHFRYLAIALPFRRCINAFQLAETVRLNTESHRLYHKPKTRSVLYWKESTRVATMLKLYQKLAAQQY